AEDAERAASTLRAHLLEDRVGVALLAARIRFVDPSRVLLGRTIEDVRVAALRVLHFLVAEERADVERFAIGGHALPLRACDVRARAGEKRCHSERSEETVWAGGAPPAPKRAARPHRSFRFAALSVRMTRQCTHFAGSLRHRCAIGIWRPLPNAFVDTRMVGA